MRSLHGVADGKEFLFNTGAPSLRYLSILLGVFAMGKCQARCGTDDGITQRLDIQKLPQLVRYRKVATRYLLPVRGGVAIIGGDSRLAIDVRHHHSQLKLNRKAAIMNETFYVSSGNEGNRVFGDLLKRMRLGAKLTAIDLAEKADVHASFINGIERGVQAPSMTKATELFMSLGVRTWSVNHALVVETGENESVGFIFKATIRGQNRRPEHEKLPEVPLYQLSSPNPTGREIQVLREEQGMSRSMMASQLGITSEHLRLIELGQRRPSVPVMFDIKAVLGLSNAEKRSSLDSHNQQIRIEALIAACRSFSDSKPTAEAIIERAKRFEAYFKGEDS